MEQSWGVVGYREFKDREAFDQALVGVAKIHGLPSRVVSGGASGADTMAREWAAERGIPFVEHLPERYTPAALLARNTLIVQDSTMVIAFLSPKSKGTRDTIAKARKAGVFTITIHIA